MKLIEAFLKKNPCYTAGRKITVKGLMLHSVGCPQPRASVFINSWNSPSFGGACVHGFIDANDGTVYQTLPWNHRGWHCASGPNGSGNNTHIGVEICEPASIRYTGGSSFTCSDLASARACARRTYQAAVELFAMLCKKYGLNPTADGVIISHREGHSRGIASNHGDPEHLWNGLGLGYTMNGFRKDVKAAMDGAGTADTGKTAIMGTAKATAEQMRAYIQKVNPKVSKSVLDMIPFYLSEGKAEGVRGDIAFAQSCLETGNFGFSQSAVTLDQNNFAGMGVTQNGMKGLSFASPQLGIRCQIQHLKAYASTEALIHENIDPRFKYVTRGSAPYVEWLGIQENPKGIGWAAGAGYGAKILAILGKITGTPGANPGTTVQEVKPLSGYVKVIYQGSDGLNVRTSPAFGNNVDQVVHGGLYTVVGISADGKWYKLKSGLYMTTDTAFVRFSKKQETGFQPYRVRVDISDLNIRKGPGTNHGKAGCYTGKGVFTIVEEAEGKGASRWGLLKAYQKTRDGWISLDYTEKY
ncbi:MAG: N-acetylmuramoyl-L-alanine amidase [Eubacteriales bacterium]|nr:N-acetylmuramoyl-L-alanine amidase [Eubacteriales bacterium]